MRRLRLLLIPLSFVAIFWQNCLGATGDVLSTEISASGRMIEKVEWQGTEKGFILISYPKEFKNSHTYHLNFWFPGTSGNPGPGIANENENYIEVCFSYLAKKEFAVGEYAKEHWSLCRKVEEHLLARRSIAVGQRVVSGVSKGGWLAFEMSVDSLRGLDGVVIVAAGILPRVQKIPNLKQSQLSVLVCTGETDVNYPFAQMAEAYYQKSGLKDYSYEEWLTRGHVSHISSRVNEWLNVLSKKKEPKDVLQSYCESLITQRMLEYDKLSSPKEKYIFLRHCLKSPASAYIGNGLRQEMITKGRELGKEETVVAWLNDYAILRKIVQAEVKVYKETPVINPRT